MLDMKNLVESLNLDPRIAMALSGEITLPNGTNATAGGLFLTSLAEGEWSSDRDALTLSSTYSPDWAPVNIIACSEFTPGRNNPLLQVSPTGDTQKTALRPEEVIRGAIVIHKDVIKDLICLDGGEYSSRTYLLGYENTDEIYRSMNHIAGFLDRYFSQFIGWTRTEDGFWVPPTAQPVA